MSTTTSSSAIPPTPNSTTIKPLQYNVILGGRVTEHKGLLTISENGFEWQSDTQANVIVTLKKQNIKYLEWWFTTRGYQLTVGTDDDDHQPFSGFRKEDYDQLNDFCVKVFNIPITKIKTTPKGMNWGDVEVRGNVVAFNDLDGKQQFAISLNDVKSCTKQPKTSELAIELHADESAAKEDDCLVEVRFVFPKEKETDEESQLDLVHKMILQKADILSETGQAVASFQLLPFVTPRGKYNVEMFRKFMRLHGGTFVFKILYKSITKMFLLPAPGNNYMYFVISLDTPVRLRRKPYFHLVFQFDKNETIEKEHPLKLNMTKEEIEQKYPKKGIGLKMTGPVFEVVAKVFRALTGKKIIGAGSFRSYDNNHGVKCSVKANEGYLFLLEKSIFFLYKPTVYFRHEDIKSIKFQRADRAGGSRYFDMAVQLKSGRPNSYVFSNIQKNEYDKIVNFISKKGIKIENIIQQEQAAAKLIDQMVEDDDDDEEDDDDFQQKEESEDEEEYSEKGYIVPETNPVKEDENPVVPKKRKREGKSSEEPPKNKKKEDVIVV